ncbi:MAG: phosphoribosylaminoimidazolesuccinocarboxamide synthase [Bacteroidota bacterium]
MLTKQAVLSHIDAAVHTVDLPSRFGTLYRGKVRDVYRRGDEVFIIASDRISAFDHILNQQIPFKGQVLNQLAAFFFEQTADIIDSHLVAVPDPNVTVARYATPYPIEFVVRGYLAGHAWREYRQGKRELCGVALPEGLKQNSRLPEPILTPATKAASGHDIDISKKEIILHNIIDSNTLDFLEETALHLFDRGSKIASQNNLILVDTKYEFGSLPDGASILIDEIHTPDSSRYFFANTYEELMAEDRPQKQLSKEFVREWLMDHGFQGKDGQRLPDMPDAFVADIALRYMELYEHVTGTTFEAELSSDPHSRIERSLGAYLA